MEGEMEGGDPIS